MQIQKNTVVFIALLTLISIFSSSASAIQFMPAQIVDFKYTPVNYVSSDNGAVVNVIFNYILNEGESLSSLFVNATDLFPNGIYSGADYSKLSPLCKKTDNLVSCSVKGLTLRTKNNTINIVISGTYSNNEGSINIKNTTTLKVSIDNSKPQVTFLGTSTCNGGICYVASGKTNRIIINMQDERATFEKASIGFKIGNKLELVNECSGMSCNGSAKITCTDGQKVVLSIRQDMSKDDIGNKIIANSTELICDASSPVINDHSFASAIGTDTLVLGKDMIFEFNVTDSTSPVLNMIIDAESVLGGNVTSQCTKTNIEGTKFICRGIVKPTIDLPGEYVFNIKIEDVVGNAAKESYKLNVLKTTNETANNWKVSSVEQSSTEFSRPNLVFERTLFARVNFQPVGKAEIVSIKPDGNCYATEENVTGIDSDIVSVKLLASQSNSVYLKISLRENNNERYDKLDNLSYECPVSIVSKKGNYYFSTPEKDNFTITIKLKDDKNIQQLHQSEIDRITENVEKQNKVIQKLDKSLTGIQQICMVCNGVSTANAIVASAESFLSATGVGTSAAYGLSQVSSGLQSVSYTGMCQSMDQLCKLATCSDDANSKATDWMSEKMGGESKIYNVLGYKDLSSSFNPYKSYIVAAATMCAPALLYHYKVYSGIQCEYLECITSDYVQYGQDISTCQQDRAYSTCMFFSGGILDAVPFVSMFRDVSVRVGEMIKDPIQLVGTATPLACMVLKGTPALHGPCVAVQEVFTSIKLTTTMVEMVEKITLASSSSDPAGDCEGILVNSKLARTKQYQIGYNVTDYNPEKSKKIGSGELSCTGGDCTFVTGSGNNKETYQIKVTDTEVLYYYGNKKISPSDMYTDNIKDVSTTDVKTPAENANKIQNDLSNSDELAQLKANYNNAVAVGDSVGAKIYSQAINSLSAANNIQNKGSDATLDQLDTLLSEEAKKLSEQSKKETIERFGSDLGKLINDVESAEKEYGKTVMNNQQELANLDKSISDVKKLERLMNKESLSDTQKKELYNLKAEIYSAQFKDESYALALSQMMSAQANYKTAQNKYLDLVSKYNKDSNSVSQKDIDEAQKASEEAEIKLREETANLNKLSEVVDNKLKTVNEESLKDRRDEIKKEIAEKKENYKKALTNQNFAKYFGTWNNAAMTSWGNAQAIAGLRSALNLQWKLANPDGKMAQVGNFLIEDVSQFEKAWCKSTVKPIERLGDTVILNSVGGDVFKTGAQIGGRKSGLVNDGTKSYYEYWVQGNVLTSKRDGLIIDVILIDSEGNEVNATQKIIGETQPINQGVQFSFGRPSAKYFTDTVNYDKICMVFGGGSLNSFFDHVQGGNTDRICQKFIAE